MQTKNSVIFLMILITLIAAVIGGYAIGSLVSVHKIRNLDGVPGSV